MSDSESKKASDDLERIIQEKIDGKMKELERLHTSYSTVIATEMSNLQDSQSELNESTSAKLQHLEKTLLKAQEDLTADAQEAERNIKRVQQDIHTLHAEQTESQCELQNTILTEMRGLLGQVTEQLLSNFQQAQQTSPVQAANPPSSPQFPYQQTSTARCASSLPGKQTNYTPVTSMSVQDDPSMSFQLPKHQSTGVKPAVKPRLSKTSPKETPVFGNKSDCDDKSVQTDPEDRSEPGTDTRSGRYSGRKKDRLRPTRSDDVVSADERSLKAFLRSRDTLVSHSRHSKRPRSRPPSRTYSLRSQSPGRQSRNSHSTSPSVGSHSHRSHKRQHSRHNASTHSDGDSKHRGKKSHKKRRSARGRDSPSDPSDSSDSNSSSDGESARKVMPDFSRHFSDLDDLSSGDESDRCKYPPPRLLEKQHRRKSRVPETQDSLVFFNDPFAGITKFDSLGEKSFSDWYDKEFEPARNEANLKDDRTCYKLRNYLDETAKEVFDLTKKEIGARLRGIVKALKKEFRPELPQNLASLYERRMKVSDETVQQYSIKLRALCERVSPNTSTNAREVILAQVFRSGIPKSLLKFSKLYPYPKTLKETVRHIKHFEKDWRQEFQQPLRAQCGGLSFRNGSVNDSNSNNRSDPSQGQNMAGTAPQSAGDGGSQWRGYSEPRRENPGNWRPNPGPRPICYPNSPRPLFQNWGPQARTPPERFGGNPNGPRAPRNPQPPWSNLRTNYSPRPNTYGGRYSPPPPGRSNNTFGNSWSRSYSTSNLAYNQGAPNDARQMNQQRVTFETDNTYSPNTGYGDYSRFQGSQNANLPLNPNASQFQPQPYSPINKQAPPSPPTATSSANV